MCEIIIPDKLWSKIEAIKSYLISELKLSEEAAISRINRMENFVTSFAIPAAYPLCRFKKWQKLGYRCAVFERDWVFAYEVFGNGIIIRDLMHTATLIQ
jgi:hypothetical protein